jgi:Transglutaminase elicitor
MKIWKLTAISTLLSLVALASDDTGSFKIYLNNFETLYNTYRVSQPQNVPWAGSYFAYGTDGIAGKEGGQESPAAKWDRLILGGGTSTVNWEMQNHSCENVPENYKEGCRGWWGHCNAWASAAIKEEEPRSSKGDFSVADQKAYLTEIWMDSGALFAGSTDKSSKVKGDWISNPEHPTSKKRVSNGSESTYEAYWDVSCRSFFLIMTNYVGKMKTGVVIDRFTGDEVWNQPVVGVRFLPIQKADISSEPVIEPTTGQKLYSVLLHGKMYWASDSGLPGGHLSTGFDIKRMTNDENRKIEYTLPFDYSGRVVSCKLYLTEKPEIKSTGEAHQVISPGSIVGPGLWLHQEYIKEFLKQVGEETYNHAHPDFIWLPTQLTQARYNANPNIKPDAVYKILGQSEVVENNNDNITVPPTTPNVDVPPPAPDVEFDGPKTYTITITRFWFKRKIKKVLLREGIRAEIESDDIVENSDDITFKATFPEGQSPQRILDVLKEAGYEATVR